MFRSRREKVGFLERVSTGIKEAFSLPIDQSQILKEVRAKSRRVRFLDDGEPPFGPQDSPPGPPGLPEEPGLLDQAIVSAKAQPPGYINVNDDKAMLEYFDSHLKDFPCGSKLFRLPDCHDSESEEDASAGPASLELKEKEYSRDTAVLNQIITQNLQEMKDKSTELASLSQGSEDPGPKPRFAAGSNSSIVKYLNNLHKMFLIESNSENCDAGYKCIKSLLSDRSNGVIVDEPYEEKVSGFKSNKTLKPSLKLSTEEKKANLALKNRIILSPRLHHTLRA